MSHFCFCTTNATESDLFRPSGHWKLTGINAVELDRLGVPTWNESGYSCEFVNGSPLMTGTSSGALGLAK